MIKEKLKGNQMKRLLLLLLSFLIIGCENNIIGSKNPGYIEYASFTVVEYDLKYTNWWRVNGTVTNTGNKSINREWYISADFYTDSTFSTYCSHTYSVMDITLYPGETVNWSITTPGGDCIEDRDDYPNFVATNIQAYK